MSSLNRNIIILLLAFSVLASLPWLVPGTGFLALFAFVPLLWAERMATLAGKRRFWIWYYSAFVLWNAFTTFWVCNATVGGGVFAVLANAFQMSLVFALFRLSRKRFSGILPYIFLAVTWIAWERSYFDAQISWPWLVLGNAFARTTCLAQWYDITGSLGGSLWIWMSNLAVFGILSVLKEGIWKEWGCKARTAAAFLSLIFVFVPALVSIARYNQFEERSEGTVDVLIAQPDFDPYEKFQSMTQAQQNGVLLGLFSEAADSSVQLMLAPETFTSDIILNDFSSSRTVSDFRNFLQDYPKACMIFGASTYEIFYQRSSPSVLAREYGNGWLESHNSAISLDASGNYGLYHKSKLVVGTEMTPFPKFFTKVDDMLGGVMGRCIGQDEISLLDCCGVPLGCAVCYESVYGEYCTDYVRKGAKFLAVITNDAWWGDTPGYKQHLSYSALRAIELRRDIARCANTGISAFINQRGDIISSTGWWTPATLRSEVNLTSFETFFVRHGDIVGRVCTLMFLLLLLLLVSKLLIRK